MIEHPVHKNILQFETLNQQESLIAFSTTISGGVSHGNYASFNLGIYSGDDAANVQENRKRLADMLSVSHLYFPYQTHQDRVAVVDKEFLSNTEIQQQELLYGVDAVVTDQKGVCIGVGTADCVPILVYDPIHKVLAAIHAGWRGTVARLPEKTISLMTERFGSHPKNLLVGIAPSISQDNFEVGEEVLAAFEDAGFHLDDIGYKSPDSNKYHLNLPLANKLALNIGGIPIDNIETAGLCTFSRADLFFSARRQTIFSGRMITGGVIL